MARSVADLDSFAAGAGIPAQTAPRTTGALPAAAQYPIALAAVALAAATGLGLQGVVPAPGLTLIFVLPEIAVAMAFGWGPSLLAAVAGALAFDFFFTEPRYSLRIASPSDIWSTALLLMIGAAVCGLASEARRRTLEAQRTAAHVEALQGLAHAVIMTARRSPVSRSWTRRPARSTSSSARPPSSSPRTAGE